MKRRIRWAQWAWAIAPCLGAIVRVEAAGIIDLGLADEFTLSQPTVQVEVGSFGSLFLNEYLLDTGASGILLGKYASDELRSLGLQTDATYYDFGVAGPEPTQVTKPYDFHYAGSNGVPLTLPATRFQTSGGDFAFYSGIAGMPLMTGRTVQLDLAAQGDLNRINMGVAFDTPLSPTLAAHEYSVPLTMFQFPASGQMNATDPLPVNAALPFAPVTVQYGNATRDVGFLLDTGAQQCILSSSVAFDLGLDVSGDGSFDDEAISFQTVAGVGGSVVIPVLQIDTLSLRASGDVGLLFHDVAVGIIDIDAAVPGVLGMNVLNSGWEIYALNSFLGLDPGPPGVFNTVGFDFRNAGSLQGAMRLKVDASRDAFIPQGAVTFATASGVQTQQQAGYTTIGGTGTITKTGLGTLVLDAVNTTTGTTTVAQGTLRIAAGKALFGSPVLVNAGGTLELAGGVEARIPSVTLVGGTLAASQIVVNGTSGIARLTVESGELTGAPLVSVGVGGRMSLGGNPSTSVSLGGLTVDLAVGGRFDIGRGRLSVAVGGITRAELLAGLVAGRGDGDWSTSSGIGSEAVAADLAIGESRTLGWLDVGDGSFVVAYAAPGDISLDGSIDLLDAASFLGAARFDTGLAAVWSDGDFNYDGTVDVLDVADFVSTSLFDAGDYRVTGLPLSDGGAAAAVSVPEPGWLALFGILAGLLLPSTKKTSPAASCRRGLSHLA